MEYYALLIIRLLLLVVFLVAGIGKLLDREGSEKALRDFEIPEPLVKPFAASLPWLEIAVAAGILFTPVSWYSAIGAAVLLLGFTAGMLWQMKKGNAPDCHCFGQIHSEPVSLKSIGRNAVLLALAIVLVAVGPGFQGTDVVGSGPFVSGENSMQLMLGLAIVGLLVAMVFILKKISDQQVQIMRRIEILDLVANEGKEVTREEAQQPQAGLPIGSPLPAFTVEDGDGNRVDSSEILDEGTPALLMFVSPTCHPCESLIPDMDSWNSEIGDAMDVILISTGDWNENVEKFGDLRSGMLYIQEERSVSELLGAQWTPTAIFIDSKGAIASRNAVGDSAIRELVAGLREAGLEKDYVYFANGSAEAMKIGEEVPEFSLADLDGNEVTSEVLRGRRTIAAFWSTTCPFCINMIEDLKAWNKMKGAEDPQLIVFSDGDLDQHKALGLDAPILLEKDYETASKIGMNGTPSAVLIDENARIVSETGIGADNIWALLGRRHVHQEETEK